MFEVINEILFLKIPVTDEVRERFDLNIEENCDYDIVGVNGETMILKKVRMPLNFDITKKEMLKLVDEFTNCAMLMLCDLDEIIFSIDGDWKDEPVTYMPLTKKMYSTILQGAIVTLDAKIGTMIEVYEEQPKFIDCNKQVIVPILYKSEPRGAIVCYCHKTELKKAEIIATFLAKMVEFWQ